MKHALLILAHKNIDHLKEIIRFFDEEFYVYVHIDKKSNITSEERNSLLGMCNVRWVGSCYSINWGGHNVLKGVALLMQIAINDGMADYYHLISGQDFPTKTPADFKRYFEQRKGTEFLDYFSLPHKGWDNGRMDRITLYCLYDYFNFKSSKEKAILDKLDVWQKRYHIHRRLPLKQFPVLYGGSCWWSLTRECVQYIVDETKNHPSLFRRLRFTFAPDEVYVQTLLLNSPFSSKIENDNLRYILWEFRNNNYPANLDETDYPGIIDSNKLFARKIEYPISASLVELLKKQKDEKTEDCSLECLNKEDILPISIVMPMYNAAPYIKECIDSILNQSFHGFELIVVDDRSTDESLSILKSYNDPRIRIIENTHDFIGSLNKGLISAQGKYIARMDADDRMAFERLSIQYEYMERHPEVIVCGTWFKKFGENIPTSMQEYPLSHNEIATKLLKFVNPIGHPSSFIRRSFLIEHNLLYVQEALYAEDLQLWVDIIKAGGRMVNLPYCLHEYRQHESQVVRSYTKRMLMTSDRIYGEYFEYVMNILGENDEELWNVLNQMIAMANRGALPFSSFSAFVYDLYYSYLKSANNKLL